MLNLIKLLITLPDFFFHALNSFAHSKKSTVSVGWRAWLGVRGRDARPPAIQPKWSCLDDDENGEDCCHE